MYIHVRKHTVRTHTHTHVHVTVVCTYCFCIDLVFHNNAWKTSMQVMTEKTMTSSVTEIFPCSSGTDHYTKELQGTPAGVIGTPAPPQVSGFQLEVFTTTLSCCRTAFEGLGAFATSRLVLLPIILEVIVIYFDAAFTYG